jgi:SAM-dependent methyltransferase
MTSSTTDAFRERRRYHAERTAQTHAAFLLPHLRPGMTLLDLGCGPGTITAGLAAAVSPGRAVGVDLDTVPVEGVEIVTADVTHLPFPDNSFDAIFGCAVLQHLADPLAALREARRVARPGAVIGVCDADWDGELLHPLDETLRRSREIAWRLREGTSPTVGKRLRHLLVEAGFTGAVQTARIMPVDDTRQAGAFNASLFRLPTAVERVVSAGWASHAELEEMSAAWIAWGEHPGAFLARFWCEALAFTPAALPR